MTKATRKPRRSCCSGGDAEAPLTETDQRILEDFADSDPRTRHTRSTLDEWEARAPNLFAKGFIEHGNAKIGRAHVITSAGLAVLGR